MKRLAFLFSIVLLLCTVSCQDKDNDPIPPENPGQSDKPSDSSDDPDDVTYKNVIRISVVDDFSSNPIYDAVVTDQNGNKAEQASDGKYLFKDLMPGTYKVEVNRRGYYSVSKSFTLQKDGFIDSSVSLVQDLGRYEITSWSKDIVFSLSGITRTSDGTVDIYYNVENKSDKSVTLDIRGYNDDCYAIDDFGNRYKPTYLKLSSKESDGSSYIRVYDQLQPLAKLPGIIRFSHVKSDATGFKIVNMYCYPLGNFSFKNFVMPGGPSANQPGGDTPDNPDPDTPDNPDPDTPDNPDPNTPDNPGSDINKTGMYKLKLTDAFTGKDIRDAIITFENGKKMTYQNGIYSINNLDIQGYEMKIERRAYKTQRHYVYASENPNTEEIKMTQDVEAQWSKSHGGVINVKLVVTGIDRTFDNDVTVYALYSCSNFSDVAYDPLHGIAFPSIDNDSDDKAFDDLGNEYSVSYRSVAGKESLKIYLHGNYQEYKDYKDGFEIPIVIKFKNVSEKAKEFKKLVIIKYDYKPTYQTEPGSETSLLDWFECPMELNNIKLVGGPNI